MLCKRMPVPVSVSSLALAHFSLTAKRVQQRVVEKKRFAGGGCAALVSELAIDFFDRETRISMLC